MRGKVRGVVVSGRKGLTPLPIIAAPIDMLVITAVFSTLV